jgi:hypothetical protein
MKTARDPGQSCRPDHHRLIEGIEEVDRRLGQHFSGDEEGFAQPRAHREPLEDHLILSQARANRRQTPGLASFRRHERAPSPATNSCVTATRY